jgi:hypothetical protein
MSHLLHVLVLSLSVIVSQDGLVMPATQGAAPGLAGRWEGGRSTECDSRGLKFPTGGMETSYPGDV